METDLGSYQHNRRMEDVYTKPLSVRDICLAFPDEINLARRSLRDATKYLNQYNDRIGEIQSRNISLEDKYILRMWVETLRDTDPMTKQKNNLILYLKSVKRKAQSNAQPEEINIDKARLFPIEQLFELIKPRTSSSRIQCCCPVHNEDTPSFIIYKNQNKFYCFGCHAHGDAIDLYMKIHSVDIKTAIKALQ